MSGRAVFIAALVFMSADGRAVAGRCDELSTKKARWLCRKDEERLREGKDKRSRANRRRRAEKRRGKKQGEQEVKAPPVVLNVLNLHTGEVLPIVSYETPSKPVVEEFLRCRWTREAGSIDMSVVRAVIQAAKRFSVTFMEVISGFRHPKFNDMLRKKGRQVARNSKHTLGKALDFRFKGPPLKDVFLYLRSLRFGGVGRYPESGFLHFDSGHVRTWRGD
jgi:uncharacterized protein YcbK (DUF882 family)